MCSERRNVLCPAQTQRLLFWHHILWIIGSTIVGRIFPLEPLLVPEVEIVVLFKGPDINHSPGAIVPDGKSHKGAATFGAKHVLATIEDIRLVKE